MKSSNGKPDHCRELPCFPAYPIDEIEVRMELAAGLRTAIQSMRAWLEANEFELPGEGIQFDDDCDDCFFVTEKSFQIGKEILDPPNSKAESWRAKEAVTQLMDTCSIAKSGSKDRIPPQTLLEKELRALWFATSVGSERPRLASRLWVRFYRTSQGFIPVMTYSQRSLKNVRRDMFSEVGDPAGVKLASPSISRDEIRSAFCENKVRQFMTYYDKKTRRQEPRFAGETKESLATALSATSAFSGNDAKDPLLQIVEALQSSPK